MHLLEQVRTVVSAFTVATRTTPLAAAPADQMTTERSPEQHQGTSRITDLEVQVTQTVSLSKIMDLIKIKVVINRQGLMKVLTGNIHPIIITSHPH